MIQACRLLHNLSDVVILNFGYNKITEINTVCFPEALQLKLILLNDNLLNRIAKRAFFRLPNLIYINLKSNILMKIPENMIVQCFQLSILSIMNNSMKEMGTSVFKHMGLKFLLD